MRFANREVTESRPFEKRTGWTRRPWRSVSTAESSGVWSSRSLEDGSRCCSLADTWSRDVRGRLHANNGIVVTSPRRKGDREARRKSGQ